MTSPSNPPHPVIVVTGANSGVGFGLCHRLLIQLSRSFPDDALPMQRHKERVTSQSFQPSPFAPSTKLTLVLACRSPERAAIARQRLLTLMDAEISLRRKSKLAHGHAAEFRKGLQIDFIRLDLASVESVFDFAEEASRRYPYITHLILNAGVLNVTKLDWLTIFKQLLTEPFAVVTNPRYLLQQTAVESSDGLGLVWQSNVFGHYSLLRLLEPLLLRNPYLDSRVEWLSSLEAQPEFYDHADPQLLRAKFPYQASKYQIDLICTTLARDTSPNDPPEGMARINHLLVHPGVCSTNMANSAAGTFMKMLMVFLFYLARLVGSKIHTIDPYKGAAAASFAGLVSPAFLQDSYMDPPSKYASRTTMSGKDYIDIDPVLGWEDNERAGKSLVKHCENVFKMFQCRRGPPSSPIIANGGVVVS